MLRFISILVLLVTLLSGCSNDQSCDTDRDCFAGETCEANLCEVTENNAPNVDNSNAPNNANNSPNNESNTPNNANNESNAPNNESNAPNNGGRTFVDLAAGETFTCALDSNGELWCWGRNGSGQLSVALDNDSVDRPQRVVGIDNVSDIAAARRHRCALKDDGTVWCWGHDYGITGGAATGIVAEPTEMPISDIVELEMGGYSACALESDRRTLQCWGSTDASPPGFTEEIVDFAVGDDHTCAVVASGNVRCWGSTYYDQSGLGDPVQGIANATAIAAGERHTCAVSDGDVYCWGWNEEGQCGRPPVEFQEKFEEPQLVEGVTGAIDVFVGSSYSCALHDSDRLTCWGGLLGYDATVYTDINISPPTQLFGLSRGVTLASAGFIHGCAAKSDEIYCWGDNTDRQLGEGGEGFRYEEPVRVDF